ncbi:MAG TPA: hypothetical protein VFR81_07065 [Longimicrobium sp.]|nr:hypothetical protein [Longimicrobium sp.]
MNKVLGSIVVAAVAAAGVTGSAGAQVCAGFPTVDRQFSFGVNAQFVDGSELGDILGVEASYNAQGPLSVFGGLTVVDGQDVIDDVNIYAAGLAYDLTPAVAPGAVSLCPQLSISYARIEDLGNGINVPLGFGIGTSLVGGTGVSIDPFIVPQLIFSRFEADEDLGLGDDDTETSTDVGVYGGVNVSFGRFWIGGSLNHVFVDEADTQFGIRAGIRL